jgi:hypothetical protein
MDSPDKLATLDTQDITKRNKTNNMTQKTKKMCNTDPTKTQKRTQASG